LPDKKQQGAAVSVFEWLEGTRLALWVGESLWGYPLMLSVHIIGLAIVVGIFTMLDLRLLGVVGEIEFEAFEAPFSLAWLGLGINTLSGLALFSSQAMTFIVSVPFLVKITSIAAGVILAVLLRARLRRGAAAWDSGAEAPDRSVHLLATGSLLCWCCAIFGGRLIAYL
jgi:hypothetical protein